MISLKEVFVIREATSYEQERMTWDELRREYERPARAFEELTRQQGLRAAAGWKFWINDADALEAAPSKFRDDHEGDSYFWFLGGNGVPQSTEWEYEGEWKTQEKLRKLGLGG